MALHHIRTDDLTGEQGAETVVITVNGKGIEVDLAAKSAERLTRALEPFWKVGSEDDYVVTRQVGKPRKATAKASTNGHVPDYDRGAVRAWAAANGIDVPSRGRIPRAIVEHYLASGGA